VSSIFLNKNSFCETFNKCNNKNQKFAKNFVGSLDNFDSCSKVYFSWNAQPEKSNFKSYQIIDRKWFSIGNKRWRKGCQDHKRYQCGRNLFSKFKSNLISKLYAIKKMFTRLLSCLMDSFKCQFLFMSKKIIAKGQTNSKWFFQADVSSKNRTNKFDFTTLQRRLCRWREGGGPKRDKSVAIS
jgi:hypothetical protein